MRVFVTGATGFIGTELVKELIEAGHSVRGLTRTDAGAKQLEAAGAEPHRGDIQDLTSLRAGARGMDGIVNLAFDHDMSKFAEHSANEMKAITALGEALQPGKVLLITSGVAIVNAKPGQVRYETDPAADSPEIPRKGEQVARTVANTGVSVGVLRMSQVHNTRKQGLVSYLVQIAKDKGVSAYVGDGSSRWAAAPVKDVAHLYRLALERARPGLTTYHAVQEEGVSLKSVAEAIGHRLGLPVTSLSPSEAQNHFGPFAHFAMLDMPASSERTQKTLGWTPLGPGLIEDLRNLEPS